jgi:Na+/H+ antiporter NhaD/arsenite permease-like protein
MPLDPGPVGGAAPLGLPCLASAIEEPLLDLPLWAGVPFVLLLLAIALLPLLAGRFWERNRNKAAVAAGLALPVAAYLLYLGPGTGWQSTHALLHELGQYVSFIILLASLYTVSGGVVLRGDIRARPLTNAAFLALGAVLANVIGTTGASMLLIRPLLQINRQRRHTRHLPVFFIFLVSNLGGVLTPLGDPPLFLGFLNGVDFGWTLALWPQWLAANGLVLAVFLLWDTLAYRRESPAALARDAAEIEPVRVHGLVNLVFLAGILAAVLLQSEKVAGACAARLSALFPCPSLTLSWPWGEALMAGMSLLSLAVTPRRLRKANGFGWGAITEVAVLFAGLFVTMVPALAWLRGNGPAFGVTEPWQYFWLTGGLSSVLDNAPTYLTFATLAAGPHDFAWLARERPLLLQAISCGAVFMGANTYIGNGPNFMVKAIADDAGYRTPSFFGYLAYSGSVLLPVFVLITLFFFRGP